MDRIMTEPVEPKNIYAAALHEQGLLDGVFAGASTNGGVSTHNRRNLRTRYGRHQRRESVHVQAVRSGICRRLTPGSHWVMEGVVRALEQRWHKEREQDTSRTMQLSFACVFCDLGDFVIGKMHWIERFALR
jgi:hypothetical protein